MGRSEKSTILQKTLSIFLLGSVIHSTLLVELCMAILVLGGVLRSIETGSGAVCVFFFANGCKFVFLIED